MSAILLDNNPVHYEVLGRGRPVVFLHSWVGSWRYWIPAMQATSTSYRAYALDLWGFGDSARYSANYTLDSQVALLAQFLDRMGIGKIALIGHGLGAAIGLFFAARFSPAVDRLLLAGLPGAQGFRSIGVQATSPCALADWLAGHSEDEAVARKEASKTDPLAVQQSLADLLAVDVGRTAARLACPCLLVQGQYDPLSPAPFADLLFSWPENLHQIMFDQSGHFPMLSEANQFNRLVADFLALASGASPRQLQLKEEWKRRVR